MLDPGVLPLSVVRCLALFPAGNAKGEVIRHRGGACIEKLFFHQVGFMKTGKVVALEVEHFSNAGNTQDLSQGVSRTLPQLLG